MASGFPYMGRLEMSCIVAQVLTCRIINFQMTATLAGLSIRQSAFISHMADNRSMGKAVLLMVIRCRLCLWI